MNQLRAFIVLTLSLLLLVGCEKSTEEKQPKDNPSLQENASTTTTQNEDKGFATNSVDDLMSKNITNFLTQSYLKDDLQFLSENDRKFQMYKIDLNGDGKDEYFVRLMGSYFCGSGGCTFLLLDRYSEIITKFTVMRPPIYVSVEKENGWRRLMVESEGKYKELVFDGKRYPSNPSVVSDSEKAPGNDDEVLFDDVKLQAKIYTY